jgi:hypothetical protein
MTQHPTALVVGHAPKSHARCVHHNTRRKPSCRWHSAHHPSPRWFKQQLLSGVPRAATIGTQSLPAIFLLWRSTHPRRTHACPPVVNCMYGRGHALGHITIGAPCTRHPLSCLRASCTSTAFQVPGSLPPAAAAANQGTCCRGAHLSEGPAVQKQHDCSLSGCSPDALGGRKPSADGRWAARNCTMSCRQVQAATNRLFHTSTPAPHSPALTANCQDLCCRPPVLCTHALAYWGSAQRAYNPASLCCRPPPPTLRLRVLWAPPPAPRRCFAPAALRHD